MYRWIERTRRLKQRSQPLRKCVLSCGEHAYGCHSNETVWPWYSRIAPVSWLVAHDVHDGREELNLSTWNRYTT